MTGKKSGFLVEKTRPNGNNNMVCFPVADFLSAKLELRLPTDESTAARYMLRAISSFRFRSFKPQA